MEPRLGKRVLRGVRQNAGGRQIRESPIFFELQISELKLRPPETIYVMTSGQKRQFFIFERSLPRLHGVRDRGSVRDRRQRTTAPQAQTLLLLIIPDLQTLNARSSDLASTQS